MGNNTFKSLGRLLPHRHHIVITSDKNIKSDSAQLEYWPSLNYKLEEYPDPFIIGGAQIYLKALELPECKFLHLSHIPYSGKADVFFPEINFNSWELIKKEEFSKFYYTLWKKIDF